MSIDSIAFSQFFAQSHPTFTVTPTTVQFLVEKRQGEREKEMSDKICSCVWFRRGKC